MVVNKSQSSEALTGPASLRERDLRRWLERSLPRLVPAVLDALAGEVAVYGTLPAEELSGDIAAAIERNVRIFIEAMATGTAAASTELAEIRHSAARRAEERVPLETVLRAYAIAARVVFAHATARAQPDEVDALRHVVTRLLDFLGTVTSEAAAGYLDEYQMIVGAAHQTDARAIDALLAGASPTALAAVFGSTFGSTFGAGRDLPSSFVALSLAVDLHDDEHEPGVDAAIAARRKLRRLRAELRHSTDDHQLSSLSADGGLVLVPVWDDEPDLPALVDALARATDVAITAAAAPAAVDDVPRAVALTREVLALVRLLDRPPGLYRLDDVLLEYQVTRPGPARDALAASLDPLDPALRTTLRTFLGNGQNRRRTALDLGIHPNTVDNRTARIHRLTGLDPTDRTDAFRLHTALLASLAAGGSII